MKFEHTNIMNFQGAFRGLRNPLESWEKSDSQFGIDSCAYCEADWQVAAAYIEANEKYDQEKDFDKFYEAQTKYSTWLIKNGVLKNEHECVEYAFIGPKDLDLAQRMIKAGDSDSKFMRQILVSVDITAPLYWWKEADTYKIGTTANSTSTMHKIASTPITLSCFEIDDFNPDLIFFTDVNRDSPIDYEISDHIMEDHMFFLEKLRQKYNETKDQRYWKELIRWLPESWLQTRTWTANYAILRNIYFQREHHRLSEWHQFCDWVKTLPYAQELILLTK